MTGPGASAADMAAIEVGRMDGGGRASSRLRRLTTRARLSGVAWAVPGVLWQALFAAVPLVILIVLSFWTVSQSQGGSSWSTQNYQRFFGSGVYLGSYGQSVWLATSDAVVALLIALPFAYTLAFICSARVQAVIVPVVVLPLFTSYLIRMYAWQAVLSDRGVLNHVLSLVGWHAGLLDTTTGVRIGLLSYQLSICILLLYAVMRLVPRELMEAARNLGANELQVAVRVVLPQTRLVAAIAGLVVFILTFGDYVGTGLLGGGQTYLFSAQISDFIQVGDWSAASALAVIMLVTLLLVFGAAFWLASARKLGGRT